MLLNRTLWKTSSIAEEAFPVQNKNLSILSIYLYANLFMASLEAELMSTTSTRPTVWWRYIDDVFAIWEHGRESLDISYNRSTSSTQPSNSLRRPPRNVSTSWTPLSSWMKAHYTQTCTQNQQTHTSTCPQILATQNIVLLATNPGFLFQILSRSFGEKSEGKPGRIAIIPQLVSKLESYWLV